MQDARRPGTTEIGLAIGAFDAFHVGHLRSLVAAAGRCEELVVAVAADVLVEAVTGKPPVVGQADRAEVVSGFGLAATIRIVSEADLGCLVESTGASVVFVNSAQPGASGAGATDAGARLEVVDVESTASASLLLMELGSPFWAFAPDGSQRASERVR